ncbi:hypothetical protein MYCTH_2071661 [Thermothelomyces thermophilus ATCC 42464]|uniref:Zn(2)-C6 fungal-type domain-containing protein n=1 Tax=Thermothelomyces thermophilus (strain ATCC 42464 / BCRC 31852 / DSM 1799) TaxID=573729 RepID=G2QNR8_THET4|nr:uncharacterized protein MYCTH_2071661 [Thermothelomyces thermophilus ATCC 42464]AEO61292.1 hypothetical protein MYCTH_2071661 [Thermothelomyces thermophilus ATCC 42464]
MPRQHLTPNACLVCRRKRTKCDGQLPCRRCRSRGEECVYEDKKWRTKDHLRSEIERLRTEQRQGQALLRALTNNDPCRWRTVLDRMTAGDPPEAIAEWILAQPSARLAGSSGRPPPLGFADGQDGKPSRGGPDALITTLGSGLAENSRTSRHPGPLVADTLRPQSAASTRPERTRRFSFDPGPSIFPPGIYTPPAEAPRRLHFPPPDSSPDPIPHTWTKVTSDRCLVQRLLARFFGSSLPYLSIVSQRHFMNDFRQGNPRFCSEALVNAVLGLACVAATPISQPVSRVGFGDAFLAEAKRLLAREEELPSLPYIQALGVLAVAEMTRGNEEVAGDLAREFARAGIRFLLQTRQQEHGHDDDFKTVRALAYCGGLSLVRLLRLLTGDLEPKTGPLFMRIYPDFRDVEDDTPEARVERGISLQVQFFAELQHCPPLARFIFEVTEAAHTFSSYNHSKAMTASDLEGAFGKCTGYYRQVAELSASDADGVGPDVLLARIWYNFCLLSLLQPFVANSASLVDGLPPSLTGHSTPYIVCRQSSEAIISLTSIYQSRYSLDYLPPLLPYMVFAAVLHQRSLAAPQLTAGEVTQEGVVLSPEPRSPDAVSDPSYSLSDRRQSMSQPGACLGPAARPSTYGREPPSPAVVAATETPRSAGHKASAFPTPPTCLSSENQACRSGAYRAGSNAPPSDTGQHLSLAHPNAQSGALPTFTSQPADLVALGSLQLFSMGAQHRGAAEASHLLRTSGSTLDIVESGS